MARDRTTELRVKIERAKEHLSNLESEITAFLVGNPYKVVLDYNTNPQFFFVRINVSSEIPLRFSAIVGDVIHNLRTSLDMLIQQLIVTNGESPNTHSKFSICDTADEFERKITKPAIQRMGQAAVDLLKSTKPYRFGDDGNKLLCALHDLDVKDKHKLLLLTGCAYQVLTIDPRKIYRRHSAIVG